MSRYSETAIKLYKRSRAMPLAAFFKAGRALKVTVTVQGLSENAWKALQKKNEEKAIEKLDAVIRVTAGKEKLRFEWIDLGKLALRK